MIAKWIFSHEAKDIWFLYLTTYCLCRVRTCVVCTRVSYAHLCRMAYLCRMRTCVVWPVCVVCAPVSYGHLCWIHIVQRITFFSLFFLDHLLNFIHRIQASILDSVNVKCLFDNITLGYIFSKDLPQIGKSFHQIFLFAFNTRIKPNFHPDATPLGDDAIVQIQAEKSRD